MVDCVPGQASMCCEIPALQFARRDAVLGAASTTEAKSRGGRSRAERLTPEQRSEIARRGAIARWGDTIIRPLPGPDRRSGRRWPCRLPRFRCLPRSRPLCRRRRRADRARCRCRNRVVLLTMLVPAPRWHAPHPRRRVRGQSRRVEHAQEHHGRPRLRRCPHGGVHDPSTRTGRTARRRRPSERHRTRLRSRDTSGWYSNYRIGETTAAVKILVDTADDTIVGAHMFGPEYGELINFCALAIKLGLTTRQPKSMTAAYPTVTSDLVSML